MRAKAGRRVRLAYKAIGMVRKGGHSVWVTDDRKLRITWYFVAGGLEYRYYLLTEDEYTGRSSLSEAIALTRLTCARKLAKLSTADRLTALIIGLRLGGK